MENLKGSTVLVTGSTDGVGRLVARHLGNAGARVVVHGRDADRGAQVVADIERAGGAATFLRADLASLAEVRDLAAAVQRATDRLDILINNAGIGTAGGVRQESADGFELRFAVNYLAGFLLTSLLLPLLRAAEPARIVNVSAAGQEASDFTGIPATCLHPATYMNTTMVRCAGVTPVSTVEQGAQAILNLAMSPALEGRSGLYFNGLREARAHSQAYDAEARHRLWALSLELTGLARVVSTA